MNVNRYAVHTLRPVGRAVEQQTNVINGNKSTLCTDLSHICTQSGKMQAKMYRWTLEIPGSCCDWAWGRRFEWRLWLWLWLWLYTRPTLEFGHLISDSTSDADQTGAVACFSLCSRYEYGDRGMGFDCSNVRHLDGIPVVSQIITLLVLTTGIWAIEAMEIRKISRNPHSYNARNSDKLCIYSWLVCAHHSIYHQKQL